MSEDAKGEDREPVFGVAPIEKNPGEGNESKKKQGVAEYPAVAECLSKQQLPQRFINNVG